MLRKSLCLVLVAALCTMAGAASARVTRVVVVSQQPIVGGASFGSTGPYERLIGTVYFEADTANPNNRTIFDLEKAPRNTSGRVEYSADFVILRPMDATKGNRALFFEVNNRGNKISLTMLNDTPPTANNNFPTTASDFGNG